MFIGEKIKVKELPYEEGSMDAKFLAKYRILDRICGDYKADTIQFTVYDHYGWPAFSRYDTVMLYVVEDSGTYYHEKYQYHNVYKTKNGRWASPYNRSNGYTSDSAIDPIVPQPIQFRGEVSFPINGLKKHAIAERFPSPFYKIEQGKAIAVCANYAEDLFRLDKRDVLAHRGLFPINNKTIYPDIRVSELQSLEDLELTDSQRQSAIAAWSVFYEALEKRQAQQIKRLSLDSVTCSICEGFSEPNFYNAQEPIDTFITYVSSTLPNNELWKQMQRATTALQWINTGQMHQGTNRFLLMIN